MDLLPLFGAEPVQERVMVDGNRITGGGITAGIDFGLHVAALLRGERTAQEIQLMMEYNPQPPFPSGSPFTADPALVHQVCTARRQIQASRRAIVERIPNERRVGRVAAAIEQHTRRLHSQWQVGEHFMGEQRRVFAVIEDE
jgi:cyclohexyl-isocyanide hydratase